MNGATSENRIAYRVAELSTMLGIPKSTLHDIIRSGELPAARCGRIVLVFATDLEQWIASTRSANRETGRKR